MSPCLRRTPAHRRVRRLRVALAFVRGPAVRGLVRRRERAGRDGAPGRDAVTAAFSISVCARSASAKAASGYRLRFTNRRVSAALENSRNPDRCTAQTKPIKLPRAIPSVTSYARAAASKSTSPSRTSNLNLYVKTLSFCPRADAATLRRQSRAFCPPWYSRLMSAPCVRFGSLPPISQRAESETRRGRRRRYPCGVPLGYGRKEERRRV